MESAELESAGIESAELDSAELDFVKLDSTELESAELESAELEFAELESVEIELQRLASRSQGELHTISLSLDLPGVGAPGGAPKLDLAQRRSFKLQYAKIRIFWGAERLPKLLVLFIPGRGVGAPPYVRTLQLYCYLLHFRPSPMRPGPNPSALPTDFACGEL